VFGIDWFHLVSAKLILNVGLSVGLNVGLNVGLIVGLQ
jgi:hypothetical protein